jgi:hypothetical protein
VKFCGDIGAYDVLNAYARGLKLASLQHSVKRAHLAHLAGDSLPLEAEPFPVVPVSLSPCLSAAPCAGAIC